MESEIIKVKCIKEVRDVRAKYFTVGKEYEIFDIGGIWVTRDDEGNNHEITVKEERDNSWMKEHFEKV